MSQFEASLQSWIRTPWAATLGRTLLHSLWEGAAIALVLTIVLAVARSSRVRYAAACVAMIAMLGGLVITFAQLAPEEPIHIRLTGIGHGVALAPALAAIPLPAPRAPGLMDNLAWLAPIWFAGVLVFYLRGVASWLVARRLRQTGVCNAPDSWQQRADRLRERLRISRPVALLESCLAEVPVVIGYMRPIILMPVGLLAGLPVGQVEAILLHELAHIRRYDYLVNLLQVFVEGLLFYHPAVWWISGVMRTERENCCDDLVVAVTGGALEYASALTALERRRVDAGMAMAATGGSLVNRIKRVLGQSERRYVAVMPVFTAAILTVTMVTAMAALQVRSSGGPVASVPAPKADLPVLPVASPVKPVLVAQASAPSPAEAAAPVQGREFVSEFLLRRDPVAHTATFRFAPQIAAASETSFDRWVKEEVAYIISDEERNAFRQLTTDEERAKFVEQFWARRDPTPGTERNEMKEEHYRRIAYVNDHYSSTSLAGWRSDRGRIYIQYGPPDEIESHSSGGSYQRPASQGGGVTETYPFEQWMYRYIDRVGQNIVMEFVDRTGNGEYRMTMDPAEKDALLHPVFGTPGR